MTRCDSVVRAIMPISNKGEHMIKQVLAVVAVVGLALAPVTSWAKDGSGPGSSAGGGNNGNGGGASHGGGHGGGDGGHGGGNGGHGGGDGGNGGNGGGNHGGGDGGHSGGGVTGGSGAPAGGSVSAGANGPGATGTTVNDGGSGYGDREHLVTVLRACTWDRLATYDTTYTGGWSVRTFDDVQWPIIYRCMKAHGYQPNGPDYTQQTNFGSR